MAIAVGLQLEWRDFVMVETGTDGQWDQDNNDKSFSKGVQMLGMNMKL